MSKHEIILVESDLTSDDDSGHENNGYVGTNQVKRQIDDDDTQTRASKKLASKSSSGSSDKGSSADKSHAIPLDDIVSRNGYGGVKDEIGAQNGQRHDDEGAQDAQEAGEKDGSSSSHLSSSSSPTSSSGFYSDMSMMTEKVSPTEATRGEVYKTRYFLKEHGHMEFIQKYLPEYAEKGEIINIVQRLGFDVKLKPTVSENLNILQAVDLLNVAMRRVLNKRLRLPDFYLESHMLEKIESAENIIVITGAGISTSLGIPDFRSSQGFYSRLSGLGLSEPQEVFDLSLFKADPSIFYLIAHMILPPEKVFTPLHAFIKLLRDKNKLLRNYTQNIDNLEANAGIPKDKVIQCHGSLATATCITCGYQVDLSYIRKDLVNKTPSFCPKCLPKRRQLEKNDAYYEESYAVFKPDITFFGENLPNKFYEHLADDLLKCDLLICIGTSLEVAPVGDIPNRIPPDVPQILINKDPVLRYAFDVSVLGYCDMVASYICTKLGWEIGHKDFHSIVDKNLHLLSMDKFGGTYAVISDDE